MAALFRAFPPLAGFVGDASHWGWFRWCRFTKAESFTPPKTAKQLGYTTGSSLASALTKAPDLEVVEAASPYLAASWERIVEELSGLTCVLESPSQGRVVMELEPSATRRSWLSRTGYE